MFAMTGRYVKGNTDTSGLLSGLVTVRSGDCGAKFKNVGNLKVILISSLYAYPEVNPYESAIHPDGFQFTIPNPGMYSVSTRVVQNAKKLDSYLATGFFRSILPS